ncbi:ABC transporter permease subunit [Paenibacillus sp. HWE-109]|uniref:ABC transporter permease n=1 Tax=Paenibacillus sp. HWE-109 TaxID=1306526 RepID=UPI001EDDBC57|nr:ABC transporter permease subunit [Paenibacillus sp. HWE-109]UKS28918.1 ABC transporter permease subunit [Paenibacillus sp. HWE-109]
MDIGEGATRIVNSVSLKGIRRNWELYLLILPALVYVIVFDYIPMYGVQIAFKDFNAVQGIWGSPWVGLQHFERFFQGYYFQRLLTNTVLISVYYLIISFPLSIMFALLINEIRQVMFKKTVQLVTYAPHFISTVVLVGMMAIFLSPKTGLVNQFILWAGGTPIDFMAEPSWFKSLYVFSGVWQNIGWNSILFIAALAGVDPQQHESATLEGASKLQRIWHINVPAIMPTVMILFIMQCGQIMAVGFEKVFLMQNDVNISASDIISTYVYRSGVLGAQYSFSAAVGLFNSVINLILLIVVNRISKRLTDTSLW